MVHYEYVRGRPILLSGLLSQAEHRRLQRYIGAATTLINANRISPCAAFTFLIGKLYALEQATEIFAGYHFINDALHYFTDPAFTYGPGSTSRQFYIQSLPWTNTWLPPVWANRHAPQGRAEGYIQLTDDPDNTGRHDHLLANAWLGLMGHDFSIFFSIKDNSPTDELCNRYGRQLANSQRPDYPTRGPEMTKWLYDKICDESMVNVAHKGVLIEDEFFRLLSQTPPSR